MSSSVQQMEDEDVCDQTVGVNSPYNKAEISMCVLCFGDEGVLPCLSLHSSLQHGAGHQLHLRRAAAVDVPQGVGSQVGHQQFRAPVQQVEHVLS